MCSVLRLRSLVSNLACCHQVNRRATVHSVASTPVVLLPVWYSSLHSFLIHIADAKHVGSATVLHPMPLWSFAGFSRWCQPSVVKVGIKRHKGSNPYHPEILYDENAAEKLVSINIGFKCIFFISIEINVLLGRLLKCCKINVYMTWIG